IARLLNRAGKPTGRGNGWTKARVCSFRSHHSIAVYRESEWAERGEITLEAAARHDGTAHGSARHHQGAPAVQGRAVGDQGGGHGCVSRTQALAALANIGSYPTELWVSVT